MMSGNMCCGVSGEALMVRVGPEEYPHWVNQPHVLPLEFAGRRPKGFILVDPEGCQSNAAFSTWIKRGLDFVATLPRKPSST